MKQIFIDRFIVPTNSKQEFIERMNINRAFIKTLPGFIKDTAYESEEEQGHFILITIAEWESQTALQAAKKAVQEAYKNEGFNPPTFMNNLGVVMERGLFREMK